MNVLILEIFETQIKGYLINNKEEVALHWIKHSALLNGSISDFNKFKTSIINLINNIEKSSNHKIKNISVMLPSDQMKITYFTTEIEFNNQFQKPHLNQMLNTLNNILKDNNLFLIQSFPFEIFIDNKRVTNPINIYGNKCKIVWSVLYTSNQVIKNFNKIFSDLYLKVISYNSNTYEKIDHLLSEDEKNLGSLVIDIQDSNSSIYLIKNHIPIQLFNLNIGHRTIDESVSIKFNISIEQATSLRKKYYSAILNEDDKNQHINLQTRGKSDSTISRYDIIKKTLPLIKKLISSLKNQLSDNKILDFNYKMFLMGELSTVPGIEFLLEKYFTNQITILNENENNSNISRFTNKIKNKNVNNKSIKKLYNYILLGLKNFYDMIKK